MGPWKLHFLLEEILVPVQFNHSRTLLMEWEPKQWVKREISSLAPLCDFFFFQMVYFSYTPVFVSSLFFIFICYGSCTLISPISTQLPVTNKKNKKKVEESNKKKESPSLSLSQ